MLIVQNVDLTPNPQALKFILNENLLKRETRSFKNKDETDKDPLAKGIFEIEGVVSVFYMQKFITIEKNLEASWGKIQKEFAKFISSFDINDIPQEEEIETGSEEETELLKKINTVLDARVRPALANDGGGMEVISLRGFTLSIRYQGACGSCPSAIRGTLVAIENLLQKEVHPGIEVIPG